MQFENFRNKVIKRLALLIVTMLLVSGLSFVQSSTLKVNASVDVILVSHTAIPFGTVFPCENVDETYTVQLYTDNNFAEYFTTLDPVDGLKNLCPFLDLTSIDLPVEPDTLVSATVTETDPADHWQVKFNVPAIEGHVSQNHDGEIVIEGGDYGCKITITVIPPVQGCSPGYWKQEQHFGSYPTSDGIYPNTLFLTVFGEDAFPGKSLLQVLEQGGGGLNALGRIIVSAYLNAKTIDGFPHTPAEVTSEFQAVYPGSNGAYNTLKDKYEDLQDPCPLGNNSGLAGPSVIQSTSNDNNKKKNK